MSIPNVLRALLVTALTAAAQPVVATGGVVNAASYAPEGFPNSGIARGAMFIVFGTGLGPQNLQQSSGLPLGTELAGTSVRISMAGASVDAYLYYTSASQLAAILPSSTPEGKGTVTVTYNGRTSVPAAITVVRRAVGSFTQNQAGMGPAIVQNFTLPGNYALNTLLEPAKPRQIAVLWATGLGPIDSLDNVQPPVGNVGSDVQVLVGNLPSKVLYAGRSAQFPGIDQVNFEIREGVEGCYVPVALKVGGVVSNVATMAIAASGSVCADATADIKTTDLESLRQTGVSRMATINLTQMRARANVLGTTVEVNLDQGQARFYSRVSRDFLAGLPLRDQTTAIGTCTAYAMRALKQNEIYWAPDDPVNRLDLNAGAVLNITGPDGTKKQLALDANSTGVFESDLGGGFPVATQPVFLGAGTYTVDNGNGGADVGKFQARITIPPLLTWINQDAITDVTRNQALTVTWSGADPATQFVTIAGSSKSVDSTVVGAFTCTERADALTFTVPTDVLAVLPVNTPWTGVGNPTGLLFVGAQPLTDSARFAAPGIDIGSLRYTSQLMSAVSYK